MGKKKAKKIKAPEVFTIWEDDRFVFDLEGVGNCCDEAFLDWVEALFRRLKSGDYVYTAQEVTSFENASFWAVMHRTMLDQGYSFVCAPTGKRDVPTIMCALELPPDFRRLINLDKPPRKVKHP